METEEVDEDRMTIVRNAMISHLVCNEEIVFKSQQIGEPDLSEDEKRVIAEDYLSTKPLSFLAKFSRYMQPSHFDYIRTIHPEFDYEIEHYIQENSANSSQVVIKNRRLEALKRLALEGDYFTEEEMRKRNPLLYEQLVGKYLSEEERKDKTSFSHTMKKEDGNKLSSLLMEQYERDIAAALRQEQEDAEEEIDSDSDDDLPQAKAVDDDRVLHLWGESNSASNYIDVSEKISDEEKKLLYEEFRSHMYRRFIGGKETDFNYSLVDSNAEYDDLDELDRDAEDKYFASDSPEDVVMDTCETPEMCSEKAQDEHPMNQERSACDNQIEASALSIPLETPSESTVTPKVSSDDPLDLYMSQLEDDQTQQYLNSKMKTTVIN